MDIREYFRKLRNAQNEIPTEFAVIMSTETPDGGKAGRLVEVTREVAAHMIVDSRGRLATDAEVKKYRAEMANLMSQAEAQQNSGKVQFAVFGKEQLRALRESLLSNPDLLKDEDAFINFKGKG